MGGGNDRIWQNFQDVWGPLRGQRVVLCRDQELRSVLTCLLFHKCTATNVPLPRKAAESQPFKEPTVIHHARQTTTPGPPTHSADFILETTNTPTQLFSHRGLTFLTSTSRDCVCWSHSGEGEVGPQSFAVTVHVWQYTVITFLGFSVYTIVRLGQNQTVSGSMSQL